MRYLYTALSFLGLGALAVTISRLLKDRQR